MNEYRKYYDYAFEVYNNHSSTSISSFTPVHQYPFYKHYFDGTGKSQVFTGSVSKSKKYPLKEVMKEGNLTKVVELQGEKSRQQMVGSSQGRRVSSAKQKKEKRESKLETQ